MSTAGPDREFYRITLSQLYHYTKHNPSNQALAACRAEPGQHELLNFVFRHAREELGHESLLLRDLAAAGFSADEAELEPPLQATDALIQYLYGVALREGPIPRLGYSYWAESVYAHIAPLLTAARTSLGLTEQDMSFFSVHAVIDRRHSEEVKAALCRTVTTPQLARAVERVALTSLWLTTSLLDQAFEAWLERASAGAGR